MKIEILDVCIIYPNEDSGINRTIEIKDEFEVLQFHFIRDGEERPGGMTLDKSQVTLLRDALNLILKNKLIE